MTPTGTRSCASSRTRPRPTSRSSRAASAVPGGADRVEFRADDPLPAEPLIPGDHNRENAPQRPPPPGLPGIDEDAIAEALRTFPGVEHRLELVGELDGVRFVNDSKATNTAAARRGIAAYAGQPLRLILGGSLKGESFDELAEELPASVRSIDLIGEATEDLAASLGRAGRTFRRSRRSRNSRGRCCRRRRAG